MTRQSVFDTVAKALIAQGKPSLRNTNSTFVECVYRAPDGCKCAAGHLIPDDEYTALMEGSTVIGLLKLSPTVNEMAKTVGSDFLRALQTAHDGGDDQLYEYSDLVDSQPVGPVDDIDNEYPLGLTRSADGTEDWLSDFKGRMGIVAKAYDLNDKVLA